MCLISCKDNIGVYMFELVEVLFHELWNIYLMARDTCHTMDVDRDGTYWVQLINLSAVAVKDIVAICWSGVALIAFLPTCLTISCFL